MGFLLRKYIDHLLMEAITQREIIEKLQPDDILTVYHGTGQSYLEMVHGIDATREHSRSYGGPRHEGIFVTSDPEEATRFASYGEVVLEIEVRAKDLHGTDYSGNTNKKQIKMGMKDPDEIWKDQYPESFSPYLTTTLLQSPEPQALLVGVIKPEQIKRVYYKEKWYTRDEFFDSEPEYHKAYERTPTKLKRLSFDPTDGSISIEEMANIISKEHNINVDRVANVVNSWKNVESIDSLIEKIEGLGWRRNAARELSKKILNF